LAAENADEKEIIKQIVQIKEEVKKCTDEIEREAKKVLTVREFEAEDGENVIWYQSLRLYNEGLVPRNRVAQLPGIGLGEESKYLHGSDYSKLKFVGIGGETGKEEIWKESLFNQIKPNGNNGKKIKLAIGITMYNEDWDEFHRTMKGVVQGIADLYNDHKDYMKEYAQSWDTFKD
jgi:hypothetical protein